LVHVEPETGGFIERMRVFTVPKGSFRARARSMILNEASGTLRARLERSR